MNAAFIVWPSAAVFLIFAGSWITGAIRDMRAERRGDMSGDDERDTSGIGILPAVKPAIHIAPSPLLTEGQPVEAGPRHRSTADGRPQWAAPTPRPLLLVAPTAQRRRELVNA